MSSKRIFLDEKSIDRQLFRQLSTDNDNSGLRKIARRALKEVVSEDLTQRQKQFIVLYYYENKTMAQIAEICEVNVSTVSRTLRRARKNILDKIKYYFIRIEDEVK